MISNLKDYLSEALLLVKEVAIWPWLADTGRSLGY